MRRLVAEIGLATVLVAPLAACSAGPNHENVPTTSVAPHTASPSPSAVATSANPNQPQMLLAYNFASDADHDVANVQVGVGYAAVQSILSEPIKVTVNGNTQSYTVEVPKDETAQKQAIYFVAKSTEAGSVFSQLGYNDLAKSQISTTVYGLKKGPGGELLQDGLSVSVVGQENDGVGLFQNIATERCQGLEVVSEPAITITGLYAAIKEGVCNSLGMAADYAILGKSYQDYEQRISDAGNLGPDVNHGYTIPYPQLSMDQYSQLETK